LHVKHGVDDIDIDIDIDIEVGPRMVVCLRCARAQPSLQIHIVA
jgi:hypothetical protein